MDVFRDFYNETMEQADPISSQYPLMDSPHKFLAIVSLYLAICIHGPRLMDSRKAYDLRKFIIAYNFAMVALSAYVFTNTAWGLYDHGYSIQCEPIDKYHTSHWKNTFWLFTMSKLVEFVDTLLFILSKKNSHVTFLHVYHHSFMSCFTWLGFKLQPGGPCTVYVFLNSFVHVIMYTYYGLAAMGPQVRKYLWWKRYLTILQLGQFGLYLTQGAINVYHDCPIPKPMLFPVYAFTATIAILFINFYVRTYVIKPREACARSSKSGMPSESPRQPIKPTNAPIKPTNAPVMPTNDPIKSTNGTHASIKRQLANGRQNGHLD